MHQLDENTWLIPLHQPLLGDMLGDTIESDGIGTYIKYDSSGYLSVSGVRKEN